MLSFKNLFFFFLGTLKHYPTDVRSFKLLYYFKYLKTLTKMTY